MHQTRRTKVLFTTTYYYTPFITSCLTVWQRHCLRIYNNNSCTQTMLLIIIFIVLRTTRYKPIFTVTHRNKFTGLRIEEFRSISMVQDEIHPVEYFLQSDFTRSITTHKKAKVKNKMKRNKHCIYIYYYITYLTNGRLLYLKIVFIIIFFFLSHFYSVIDC